MNLMLLALGIWLVSGVVAVLLPGRSRLAAGLSAGGLVTGAVIAAFPTVRVLMGETVREVHYPWRVPGGSFFLQLDGLSALFIFPMLVLAVAVAIYGVEYLGTHKERRLGIPGFFLNLLVASMVMVVLARNAVLFLMAWEVMALASFFLVTFEDDQLAVREAGWIYLIASHLGTAFIFALFVLMGRQAGSMDFDQWGRMSQLAPALAGTLFVLAVVGFGTKAGFMPFHVWLPEAHPAAPSHVSALMSGVMIKTGLYGLIRTLTFLGPPPIWWGAALLGVGIVSGVVGVLYALSQHDIKRLLAYSSVENMGIMTMGLGAGLLGMALAAPAVALLGFSACLIHMINHAFFKGLLFLGAGSVLHATGTRSMDRLGGLLRKMPATGLWFVVGSVAICGIPPLNGFISELLLFWGGYQAVITLEPAKALAGVGLIAGLAMIGGLAVVCFTKVFGVVFLGEARTPEAAQAHDCGKLMRAGMGILAVGCAGLSLGAPWVLSSIQPTLITLTRLDPSLVELNLAPVTRTLTMAVLVFLTLSILLVILTGLRLWLLKGRKIEQSVTWDCGCLQPAARIQYTGSSYVQPVTALYRFMLGIRRVMTPPRGYFPERASFASDMPDICQSTIYQPAFARFGSGLGKMRWLQHGHVQLYVLYIVATLLVLFIWKLS